MKLAIALARTPRSSHEGLEVRVTLENDEAQSRRLPDALDRTDALTFVLLDRDGRRVRRMNGLTRQAMMIGGRLDETPSLDDLAPGAAWEWTVDLAGYHFALPPGTFSLEAEYVVPAESIDVRSERVPVVLSAPAFGGRVWLQDNPVIERLSLLLPVGEGDARHWVLRQHNTGRPFAAWYSRALEGLPASASPFLAAARVFAPESFDAMFDAWVVAQLGGTVLARRFERGEPQAGGREAALPPGRILLPTAAYEADGALLLFMVHDGAVLEAWDWNDAGLARRFEHALEPGLDLAFVRVRADCDFIHLVTPHRGLLYERLTLDGRHDRRDIVHLTGRRPLSVEIQATSYSVSAVFADPKSPAALELVAWSGPPLRAEARVMEQVVPHGEVREVSFDRDPESRFHLLVSSSTRELFYLADGRERLRLAEGEERFHPLVSCGPRTYVGCYEREQGYRMLPGRQLVLDSGAIA